MDDFDDVTPLRPREVPRDMRSSGIYTALSIAALIAGVIALIVALAVAAADSCTDDDDDAVEVDVRCSALERAWPADAGACPPAASLERVVAHLADPLGPNAFQYVYYSRRCGRFDYVRGVRNASSGAPLLADTRVPIGAASRSFVVLALFRLARRGVLPLAATLDSALPRLFGASRVTYANLFVAPRHPYTLAGDVRLSPTPVAAEQLVALVEAAGATRSRPSDASLALSIIAAQRRTQRRLAQLLELKAPRLCSLEATSCPSEGVPPQSLSIRGDNYALTGAAIAADASALVARQCYSSARDVLKSWHALFDNRALRDAERALFEASFVRCESRYDDADACSSYARLYADEPTSPSYWGTPGFVRLRDGATARPLANRQLTAFSDAGTHVVRWDALGSYSVLVAPANSSALARALAFALPALDAAEERFVADSTSTLDGDALGPSPVGAERVRAHAAALRLDELIAETLRRVQ